MSAPRCTVCLDTGSKSQDIDGFQDCTACDAVERRAELLNYLSSLSPLMSPGCMAWAAYNFGMQRPVAELGVAEGVVRDYVPESFQKPDGTCKRWCGDGECKEACVSPSAPVTDPVAAQPSEAAHQQKFTEWPRFLIDPTAEMFVRGGEEFFDCARAWKRGSTQRDQDAAGAIFAAMLAAAPLPEAVSAAPSGEVEKAILRLREAHDEYLVRSHLTRVSQELSAAKLALYAVITATKE